MTPHVRVTGRSRSALSWVVVALQLAGKFGFYLVNSPRPYLDFTVLMSSHKFIKALRLASASSALLFSTVTYASTVTWHFETTSYLNPAFVFASGDLVTDATADSLGHYKILDVSGFYGSDLITGLASRVWRALPGFSDLDNFISVSPSDSPMSCDPNLRLGYAFLDGQPHFTCAGASFQTTRGVFNLVWGGATDLVIGYDGNLASGVGARHSFSVNVRSVPEPSTLALALCAAAFGAATSVNRWRGASALR